MTQKLYSVPASGPNKATVAVAAGTSIGTDIVRVYLDDATAPNRQAVFDALDVIKQKIIEAGWPL
jgi:hypothetical protein